MFLHGFLGNDTLKTRMMLEPAQDEILSCTGLEHWVMLWDCADRLLFFAKTKELLYFTNIDEATTTVWSTSINNTITHLIEERHLILRKHTSGYYWGLADEGESKCELTRLFRKYLPDLASNTKAPAEMK